MPLSRRHFLAAASALLLPGPGRAQEAALIDAVLSDPDAPVLGNPQGDVTLVEFFDYQCPYCKIMHPLLLDIVARDGNVRLVMKDWPVFGAPSVFAAQLALGAVGLGAYDAVHGALMQARGPLDFDAVAEAVEEILPLDDVLATYEAQHDRWEGLLRRTEQQATELGFIGTPSFVIGRALYPGALDATELAGAIAAARG